MEFTREIQPAGESIFKAFAKQFVLCQRSKQLPIPVLLISVVHPELAIRLDGINKALRATESDGHVGYFAFNDRGAANYKHMSFIKEFNASYVWEKIISVDHTYRANWCGVLFFPVWAQITGGVLDRITKHTETIRGCSKYQFTLGHRPNTYYLWDTLSEEQQKEYRQAVELTRTILLTGMERYDATE